MNLHRSLSIMGLATLGLALTPNFASAITITRLSDLSDAQFNDLRSSQEFQELLVAEGRMGNNALNGDRELGINNASSAPVAQGQFVWQNGEVEEFLLQYDGSQVSYSVGDTTLLSNVFSGSVNNIYIRTRETATSNVRLDNLFLNGIALGDNAVSEPNDSDRVDYLRISDISVPFTLAGNVTMSWTDSQPDQSNLAYQIKVGETTDDSKNVPEPGTVGALLLTGIIALGCSKRKRVS
ncbi:MAG TPA: choice-of-anchor W domain-containing protein [Coleofasciculaceae cyanobacterium]